MKIDGLLWLLALLGPFLILQRSLHREIQAIFLLLTRRPEIALALFSLLFFPGVLLHEISHYLIARLLGVRTGRFSLAPRPLGNGKLQLGFVETVPTDWLRDALIGIAPLLTGGAFVAYAGLVKLGLPAIWEQVILQKGQAVLAQLAALGREPDFWLWFYLAFTVSSMMLPSASDRRAWLPLVLVIGLVLAISLLAGGGPWLTANLAGPLNRGLRGVAAILGVSLFTHLLLLPPAWGVRKGLSRLTGMQVV